MGEGWWRVSPASEQAARALLYRLGPERFRRPRAARLGARRPQGAPTQPGARWRRLPQRWTAPVFPLKAADFITRGVAKGPALGAAMRAAEEAWIAADFPGDDDADRRNRDVGRGIHAADVARHKRKAPGQSPGLPRNRLRGRALR